MVIKRNAQNVDDNEEKTDALNALIEKYQKEGKYESLDPYMREVSAIKIVPQVIRGKYNVGQHWSPALKMARNILSREGGKRAKDILDIMGIAILTDGNLKIREESVI